MFVGRRWFYVPIVFLVVELTVLAVGPTLGSRAAAPEPALLYVFAGQSNMINTVTNTADLASVDPSARTGPANVRFWGPTEDSNPKQWTSLTPPTEISQAYSHSGFGPEIGAAPLLGARHAKATIGFVKLSRSATSLAQMWNPKNRSGLYPTLLEEVRGARRALEISAHRPVRIAGFFWMQGETDAHYLDTAQAYDKNLREFIAHVRVDLAAPTMPFVIGEIPELKARYPTYRYCSIVQAAERDVAAHVPWTFYVATDKLPKSWSTAHFDSQGTVELGRLFVESTPTL